DVLTLLTFVGRHDGSGGRSLKSDISLRSGGRRRPRPIGRAPGVEDASHSGKHTFHVSGLRLEKGADVDRPPRRRVPARRREVIRPGKNRRLALRRLTVWSLAQPRWIHTCLHRYLNILSS